MSPGPPRRGWQPLDRLFASLYDRVLAPCERSALGAWRQATIATLSGRVLDLGAGTGVNLGHFGPDLRLVLAEPSGPMRAKLAQRARGDRRVEAIVDATAESLPFPDASFDGVALGLVLCSVRDPARAVAEVVRVLRPGGRVAFVEHVGATSAALRRLQRLVQPVWTVCGRGCRLTRDTEAALRAGGLQLTQLSRDPIPRAFPVLRPAIHGVAIRPGPPDLPGA